MAIGPAGDVLVLVKWGFLNHAADGTHNQVGGLVALGHIYDGADSFFRLQLQ